jgi:hypothetical protein
MNSSRWYLVVYPVPLPWARVLRKISSRLWIALARVATKLRRITRYEQNWMWSL